MKKIAYLILMMTLPLVLVFAESVLKVEQFRVEGISHDAEDPAKSMAILNSDMVRTGDVYQGYIINKITRTEVHMTDENDPNAAYVLKVEPRRPEPAEESPSLEPEPAQEPAEPANLMEAIVNFITYNPLMRYAHEAAGVAGLRQVQIAAIVYFTDYGTNKPVTVEQLVVEKLLDPEFENGIKGEYRYRIKPDREGYAVYADPVNPNAKMRHFYVGSVGPIRQSKTRPADENSETFNPLPF